MTITRHSRAVAVVVHPDALRVRRAAAALARAATAREALSAARRSAAAPEGSLSQERAEELIDEARAARGRRS